MSESWDARKKRVLKVREGFPESLREIPLRYVEAVAGLSQDALRALDRAYRDEPVNIPRAIQYIREHLVLSIEDLREFARPEKPGPKRGGADTEAFNPSSSQPKEILNFYPDERDTKILAKLLMACYPSMPEISAGAMAASEVMREALKVVAATREAIESSHAQSDFVILSLFQLFSQSKNLVLEIIRSNPAFQQALEQSRIALD
jgi:hypothetical protein